MKRFLVQFGDWPDEMSSEFNDVLIVEADSSEQAELKALCHQNQDKVDNYQSVEQYRQQWCAQNCDVALLDQIETIK